MEKQCTVCERMLPLDRFPIRRDKRYASRELRRNQCKTCTHRYEREWVRNNPERRQWTRIQSTLRRKADGVVPSRATLRDGLGPGRECYICGQPLAVADREVDHKKPLALGGTNAIENLAWAHKSCNRMKHDLDFEVFLDRVELILKRHRGT